ncbi:MAG TPA: MFS transporter [Ktedonosporobacter sp.]|jgi:DHA3 family tetracycline resistance protein-like MFS transporter|nr:MFS transporter [Ktedonosporobacter sp.]
MSVYRRRFSANAIYLIFSGSSSLFFALIVTVNLVYQVEVAKLNPLQLILVGTALEVVCFIFQVPTGILADIYGRRLAVIIGTIVIGVGFILEGSIPRFETIMLAQGLFGVGATFTDGAEQAWIAGEVGEDNVGALFVRATQIGLLGGLLGALFSAVLASIRLNLPIVIGGGLYVALALFLVFYMPEHGFRRIPKQERPSWRQMTDTFRTGLRLVRLQSMLLIMLTIQLFFGLSSEGYDRLSTAHFLANFTFPALWQLKPVAWFGIFSIAGTLLSLAVTELIKRRLDINHQRTVIATLFSLNLLGVLCVLVFALTGNFFLAVLTYLGYGTFRRAIQPVWMTWLTRNTSSGTRATVISLVAQVDALGQIAGGPPVGYIGVAFSLRAALASVSVTLSPVLLFLAYAWRKAAPSGEPVEEENTVTEPV